MGSDNRDNVAGPSFRNTLVEGDTIALPSGTHITTQELDSSAGMMLEPPPPLPMDDPLDPPPTIDVGYLTTPDSREVVQDQPPRNSSSSDAGQLDTLSVNDPPPYAIPTDANEQSSVTHPPPYV